MLISTNKHQLDIDLICDFLANQSYWAKDRSFADIQTTIDNSMCFGVYDDNRKQIGFARVVTDYIVFGYIMDVFVVDEYRRMGVGKFLMEAIVNHPDLKNVKRIVLATKDMHKFYQSIGFVSLGVPEFYMERTSIIS
ncbi:MAG: GNAT family N-acetyltransferase [Flavobacteriales bacterium]|nr:GNAT family N-acetyltransferase [Flavobacteriales bacterium]